MRAIDAINPQSVNFKEAREAGITTCASGPGSLNVIGMGIAATLRNLLFQTKAYAADPNHKFDMKLEGQTLRGDPGSGSGIH